MAIVAPSSRAHMPGKSGFVEDRNTSKTGHVTITVRQDSGVRFKTLARNVRRGS